MKRTSDKVLIMNKSIESLIQHDSGNMSSERQSSEDVQESTATADDAAIDGDGDFTDDNNFESNLRRRKGKIISCAKETIENGEYGIFRNIFLQKKSSVNISLLSSSKILSLNLTSI